MSFKMPVAFVTDFGPFPALGNDAYTDALGSLGESLPRPRAIVIMSGHWAAGERLAVSGAAKPGIVHDYHGFPDVFYQLDYPCPGEPALARRIAGLLTEAGFPTDVEPDQALDHGAWVPLSRIFPKADIPVVQLTVPAGQDPRRIFEIGRALNALRDDGVLLLGSGALGHNLRRVRMNEKQAAPDSWAVDFNAWISEKLSRGALEDLFDYRTQAPGAELAAPTTEHFDPFFFTLGAADGETPVRVFNEIQYGNGILRIFTFGRVNVAVAVEAEG